MDRRMMLAAVAAAVAAVPATAQTAAPAPMGAMAPMGSPEMDHAAKTAMVGGASLKIADIGLEKATRAKVKEFAKFEHDEQVTVAEILMSMDPAMKPPAPDAKTAATIEKLSKMPKGAAFDRAFLEAQTEGHEMLLKIQDDYLKAGKDRETINGTKLIRGMVKEHLALLADLKTMA